MALQKSHMDDYMQHPGKVIKQNNKYYFQAVLNNASFWKEYKFYNANNQELATTVVNDDKKLTLEQSTLLLNLGIRV